ncbi:hypothetical protein [Saliphagus sp. LR7]|uniref:hypothetical protein n=1 Tax=Saliphagus sp. LR7 TaxID=2282654 RepID=UPI000DF76F04|nr:hypothetical protein [Saliphagus sp. LR7]
MSDGLTVRDVLQVAQRALTKGTENQEQIDDLREKQEELVEDVTAIKLRQSEMDDERPYQALSTDEKVGMVREHAFQRAVSGHGKATLDYNDVMWSVFDGKPGSKHCYKLMRLAAGVDADGNNTEDVPGFTIIDDRPMKLAVDAEEAKRGWAFFPENKAASGEVR